MQPSADEEYGIPSRTQQRSNPEAQVGWTAALANDGAVHLTQFTSRVQRKQQASKTTI